VVRHFAAVGKFGEAALGMVQKGPRASVGIIDLPILINYRQPICNSNARMELLMAD
jgi:hypothetical protein